MPQLRDETPLRLLALRQLPVGGKLAKQSHHSLASRMELKDGFDLEGEHIKNSFGLIVVLIYKENTSKNSCILRMVLIEEENTSENSYSRWRSLELTLTLELLENLLYEPGSLLQILELALDEDSC